jgi:hypothetical protein
MREADTPGRLLTDEEVRQQLHRMTRRSFTVGGVAALLGLGGWAWLRTRYTEGGIPWPLRRTLEFNERLARGYFKGTRLAPTFPRAEAREPRVNGSIGLGDRFNPSRWALRVETPAQQGPALTLTLDAIKALPRTEMVTQLKCVEGWSVVVQWAGARLADFMAAYRLGTRSGLPPDPEAKPGDLLAYVGLETPRGDYYVGLDMESALHPQTLLCYEMNGVPLALPHGGPLRLFTTVKYGYKSLKRIGTIRFTDQRPADFWAERGYDWYGGH